MEIYFNELSLSSFSEEQITYDQLKCMTDAYKALKQSGVDTCRIAASENAALFEKIRNMPGKSNILGFYFSFFKSPFESKAVNQLQEEYIKYKWVYNNKECIGPAMAYILESVCFSLYHTEWVDSLFNILKNDESIQVANVSISDHVDVHQQIFEKQRPVELIKCELRYSEKEVSFRDDHGKDVLLEFAKRVIKNPYVIGVVNSLPFNPHERKFIRKVREDGLIEIVLVWTDRKYGMVIKTTGRNKRETEAIAGILEEKYGYVL